MRKDLDLDRLTYYSNKLKTYLNKKFKSVTDSISALSSKVDSDKVELEGKIVDSSNSLSTNIQNVDNKFVNVDNKFVNLQTEIDNINLNPIDGDVINISNVQQYELKNVAAGEVIKIDNNGSDVIVDAYTEFTTQSSIDYKIINLNSSTRAQFECDERFIEVSSTGLKPKDNITLNYTKTSEVVNGLTFDIYTSDVLPVELANSIESILTIGEN